VEYDFTLKFKLGAKDTDDDAVLKRLRRAGCEDALVGMGQSGRITLNFIRSAKSAQVAMLSACSDVKKALPSAKLLEAGPDFVGLTDIADLLKVSRQNMRKLTLSNEASFPPFVHAGSASFWHLAPILQWLKDRGSYEIEPALLEVAEMTMQINLSREEKPVDPAVRNAIRALL
jgi:hypothetical protein